MQPCVCMCFVFGEQRPPENPLPHMRIQSKHSESDLIIPLLENYQLQCNRLSLSLSLSLSLRMLKTARETIKLPPALQFGARLIDRSLIINQMEILYIYIQ